MCCGLVVDECGQWRCLEVGEVGEMDDGDEWKERGELQIIRKLGRCG